MYRNILILIVIIVILTPMAYGQPDTLWTNNFGSHLLARSIKQTVDGGYIVLCNWTGPYTGIFLIKTNSTGDSLWARTISGSEYANDFQVTSDGGYIITGTMDLAKTDSMGNLEWYNTFGRGSSDTSFSVKQTVDNGYIIAGCEVLPPYHSAYIVKTDENGDTLWTRLLSFNNVRDAYSIDLTTDGGYIVAGVKDGGSGSTYLLKLDNNGNTIWTKNYLSRRPRPYCVKQTMDGGYIIVGDDYGCFGIKTDPYGDTIWSRNWRILGSPDTAYCVRQLNDGGYIIAAGGFANLIRTNGDGDTLWTRNFPNIITLYSVEITNDGAFIVAGNDRGNAGIAKIGGMGLSFNMPEFDFDIIRDSSIIRSFALYSMGVSGYVKPQSTQQWITFYPDSIYLTPGDTQYVEVNFNASGLDYITYLTEIGFISNRPGLERSFIPVEITVYPAVDISVDIPNSNVTVGDTLSSFVSVVNPTYKMTQAWIATAIQLPNGNLYGPVFGPYNIRLLPYGTLSGRIDHIVPAVAPFGEYQYLVRVATRKNFQTVMGEGGDDFSVIDGCPTPWGGIPLNASHRKRWATQGGWSTRGDWTAVYSDFGDCSEYGRAVDINVPTEYMLYPAYPNPFNSSTTITYSIPEPSDVRLCVYNLSGQLIETLVDAGHQAGEYNVNWDGSEYSSGIYFYRLTSGDKSITKRMTLLK
jgi:hypothetical protein